ncbi:B3 DNA binding domain-containing protein [Cynara cardunculus var. scolymus]|uniref:B3 DNA binding domain-containing protein n=1 Tax=Cynara cardunculus var. scolymus TaxID=59895 RepID=A0A118K5G3_CYNCS|nr:B3 DNA binding domain-containing protein [Cynara cardunculus var. scolymus]
MEFHSNFIKIILSHRSPSTGIRIPNKFTDKHGKELLDRVILKLPDHDVWQLHLFKSRRQIWLKNGWSEFAHHYGLRFATS